MLDAEERRHEWNANERQARSGDSFDKGAGRDSEKGYKKIGEVQLPAFVG